MFVIDQRFGERKSEPCRVPLRIQACRFFGSSGKSVRSHKFFWSRWIGKWVFQGIYPVSKAMDQVEPLANRIRQGRQALWLTGARIFLVELLPSRARLRFSGLLYGNGQLRKPARAIGHRTYASKTLSNGRRGDGSTLPPDEPDLITHG